MNELEAALVIACRRGDAAAFRRLVEIHQQKVYSLCVALLGADGEDAAQETFLRVFRAIGEFEIDGPASLRGWILCIARRLCHDRARHLGFGIEVSIALPDIADPSGGPDQRLDEVRLRERLLGALAQLPEEQRLVIALREWEGLDYHEIAEVAGVPIGTVRSRLARARAGMRRALAEPTSGGARVARA